MAGCEASWSGMSSGEWWLGRLRNNTPNWWKSRVRDPMPLSSQFDLISRNSMMEGLRHVVDGEQIFAFRPRVFYGQPSTYLWEDDSGEVHTIPQGEGGEQGDPLMPLLFCLGPALSAASAQLEPGKKALRVLGRYLPERGAVFNILER